MRLKKHICKRCRKKWCERNNRNPNWDWDDYDDEHWEHGKTSCPYDGLFSTPTSKIPPHCPYALEHLTQKD